MPGSPDPTFGNESVDTIVAGSIALAVVAVLYSIGNSVDGPWRFALGSGIGYALVCFGAYVLPRLFYSAFVSGVSTPEYLAAILVFMLPALVALGGVPAYLYASLDSVGALVGLFLATVLIITTHLGIGGESDTLVLYPMVLPPLAAGAILVPVAVEVAVRAIVVGVIV